MKLLVLLPLLLLVAIPHARADLTVVQTVEGAGPVKEMKIMVKGSKARIEAMPEMYSLVDSDTGDITTVFDEQKRFVRISGEKAKAFAGLAKDFAPNQSPAEKPKLVPTGKHETINGFETEEYTAESAGTKSSYWIASHYPDAAAILQQLQTMQSGSLADLNKNMPDYRAFPGLPIRSRIKTESQGEFTSTITSVKQDPLPASLFEVPKDYESMKMPAMPGPKQPATSPVRPDKSNP